MNGHNYSPHILLYIFERFVFNVSWELFICLIIIIFNYEWLFVEMLVITDVNCIFNI
jgi:hypothetical protein